MQKYAIPLFIGLLITAAFSSCAYALTATQQAATIQSADWIIKQAFLNKKSGLQVQGQGTVKLLLSDDLVGSRHQRFILRLNSGQTLLVAHNVDIAPRLVGLKVGEIVSFYGQYEWNTQGGVIHWTHHDPAKRHINGWLKYHAHYYQ